MNLFNQFISSAVRQVGRDGGRIISNKVYGNQHATKISVINENISYDSSKNILSYDELGYKEGEKICTFSSYPKLTLLRWLWIIFIIPIPILGLIGSLIFAYKILIKKYYQTETPLVWKTIKINDRRTSLGYREESILTQEESKKEVYELVVPNSCKIFSIISIIISLITTIGYIFLFLSVYEKSS